MFRTRSRQPCPRCKVRGCELSSESPPRSRAGRAAGKGLSHGHPPVGGRGSAGKGLNHGQPPTTTTTRSLALLPWVAPRSRLLGTPIPRFLAPSRCSLWVPLGPACPLPGPLLGAGDRGYEGQRGARLGPPPTRLWGSEHAVQAQMDTEGLATACVSVGLGAVCGCWDPAVLWVPVSRPHPYLIPIPHPRPLHGTHGTPLSRRASPVTFPRHVCWGEASSACCDSVAPAKLAGCLSGVVVTGSSDRDRGQH